MLMLYILLGVWLAIFLFASYHAIVNGYTVAKWVTGFCLWMLAMILIGIKMFG